MKPGTFGGLETFLPELIENNRNMDYLFLILPVLVAFFVLLIACVKLFLT